MRDAAAFIATQSSSAPASLLTTLAREVQAAFRAWDARRRLTALMDLDDHMLSDVGLCREDVRWALSLPFSHDPGLALQRRALRQRAHGWRT